MAKEEVRFIHGTTPQEFSQQVIEAHEEGYRIVPHTTFSVYENITSAGGSYITTHTSSKGFFACEMVLDYFSVSSS